MTEELYLLGSEEEMTISTLLIVEGTENKRPGVLCEVEGPFIVLNEENNNDRWYTKSLIDNRILNIPYTKKMLDNKTLYGEASHPTDRFDVRLPLISHNITELWYNEDNTILMGHADVLDTPSGRIIYTLVKYGSKLGISVRARGRLLDKGGKKIPDEKVYQFKTFDFVPNPGFDEARMSRVDESVEDVDLAKSFMSYVNEASVSELSCIQSIFESANEEVFGEVKKVIESRMSENTLTHDKDDTLVADVLYEETVKNEEQILELEEHIDSLKGSLDALEKEKNDLSEEVSTLKENSEKKAKDIENISHRLITLTESEAEYKQKCEALGKRVKILINTVRGLRESNTNITQKLEESEQKVDELDAKYSESLRDLNEAQDMVEELESKMSEDIKEEMPKRKNLPQGRSQVLNESVVDEPIVLGTKEETNTRRVEFIRKCSL